MTDEIARLKERHVWTGLESILAVTATPESDNKVTEETRYFVSLPESKTFVTFEVLEENPPSE